MKARWTVWSFVVLASACGSKAKPVVKEPVVVEEPPPPPPPPPVCVAPTEVALIEHATSDGKAAQFCVSDGSSDGKCFGVDLAGGKYSEIAEAPTGQPTALEAGKSRVETTPTEVRVCVDIGDGNASCTTLKPKVAKGATQPIQAVANPDGTMAVALLGNAEAGKGVAEVWDVGKKKKVATIKYAKGDYKCGHAEMLGETVYITASVCAGPAARGTLWSLKGKKLGDAGGKDFGTFGTSPVQVDDATWAFLEEGAGTIALQDVSTGVVGKTIDLVALWAGSGSEDAPRANGNPGESALVRGAEGNLVVVTGSPVPGNVGVVDLDTAEVKVWKALACKAEAAAEPAVDDAADDAAEETGGAEE